MSFVVLPEFVVEAENLDAFLKAARDDAEASMTNEKGCQQFDVIVDIETTPIRVMFYEVYDDRAAFDRHLQTPHLAHFRAALHLVQEGPVRFFDRVVAS
ncbi:putative quinol monooxygenase [Thalassospira sp. TSL5-1]|uniref:putative quinol monooxygenase n=1 Tax=Thalassospira sp. TSL5-1 TaxID=1544451 RepID=UPI00093BFCAB|nr:putative quinol monooxygenase [Thalassospira sp. TSL5-1]OKH86898.1 hypothetical protein LF95_21140 [Thalassospira sp. TSL5-1]